MLTRARSGDLTRSSCTGTSSSCPALPTLSIAWRASGARARDPQASSSCFVSCARTASCAGGRRWAGGRSSTSFLSYGAADQRLVPSWARGASGGGGQGSALRLRWRSRVVTTTSGETSWLDCALEREQSRRSASGCDTLATFTSNTARIILLVKQAQGEPVELSRAWRGSGRQRQTRALRSSRHLRRALLCSPLNARPSTSSAQPVPHPSRSRCTARRRALETSGEQIQQHRAPHSTRRRRPPDHTIRTQAQGWPRTC